MNGHLYCCDLSATFQNANRTVEKSIKTLSSICHQCIPLSRDTPILRMRIITDDSFRQVETCALSIVLGRLSDIQVIHQSFIVRSRYPRHLVILSREQKIQS